MKRRIAHAAAVVAVAFGVAVAPSPASALEAEAGAVVGGNWNYLERPNDPEGEDTFLWGSAFSGLGALVGATGRLEVAQLERFDLSLNGDLLYGYHRGQGWAEHDQGGRIDVLFTSHVLRLPLMVEARQGRRQSGLTAGAGVEGVVGLVSTATVETTDLSEPVAPVYSTPKSTVAAVVALGYDWVGDDFTVPFDVRLAWNPFMASATEDRFENYESRQNPGEFGVGFDWQILVSAGVRIGVGSE